MLKSQNVIEDCYYSGVLEKPLGSLAPLINIWSEVPSDAYVGPPLSEASSSLLHSSNRSFLEASPRIFSIAFADSPYLNVHYDKTVSMFAIAKSALRSDFRVF